MDVAVIGAGISGLEAARVLAAHHVNVELFEASDRLGGRIRTLYESMEDLPVELGPEFVHGDPEILRGLVHDGVIALEEGRDTHYVPSEDGLADAGDLWQRFSQLLEPAHQRTHDESARAYMQHTRMSPEDAALFAMFVEGFYGASLDTISIESVADDAGGAGGPSSTVRPRDGYGHLVHWITKQLENADVPIHVHNVVRSVDWHGDEVVLRIRHLGGEHEVAARRVIVTLPVAVLQADAVRFTPSLGDHAEALSRLAMGQVVKVVLTFRYPVWRDTVDESVAFIHQPGATFPTCWIRERAGSHHVIAWAGGPNARALAGCSHDEIVGRAIANFASFVGMPLPRVATAMRAAYMHDYASDPFVRGAYSYARAGGLDAPGILGRPLADRVFFAGEATSGPYEGTVTGALASGARSAGQILRLRGE
ncbi:MAG: NAD(P)/FAD-dependent oxidoreductase [Kofleriaceae bacterium]|nr:NAD(P)/FAD-dependent oxidoreductase [Kofleriaceae bacterium]